MTFYGSRLNERTIFRKIRRIFRNANHYAGFREKEKGKEKKTNQRKRTILRFDDRVARSLPRHHSRLSPGNRIHFQNCHRRSFERRGNVLTKIGIFGNSFCNASNSLRRDISQTSSTSTTNRFEKNKKREDTK